MSDSPITAAFLIIGNEILSGRTQDKNVAQLCQILNSLGIDLSEVRFIPDKEERIVTALNALRQCYTYVFTSGGIGPTHDDITADCVAKAFGVSIDVDPRAFKILDDYYKASGREMNEARLRMTRIPEGAGLIKNTVTHAPGFHIGNVFVMAGVPAIFKAMLGEVVPLLKTGATIQSRSIVFDKGEGDIATSLADVQKAHLNVSIGSYPHMKDGRFSVEIVLRSRDIKALDAAYQDVKNL